MKKHLLPAFAALLGSFALTSCLGDGDSNETTYTYNYGGADHFNIVTDLETGSEYYADAPSYEFKFINGKDVDATLSNVALASGYGGLAFKLPTLPYAFNQEGFVTFNATDIAPVSTGSSNYYTFNNFTFSMLPGLGFGKFTGAGYEYGKSIYNITYTLNNRYRVVTIPCENPFIGMLTSTNLNPEEDVDPVYTNARDVTAQREAYYRFVLNTKELATKGVTADLYLYNARFSNSSTSQLTLRVKDLPVVMATNGFNISTGAGTNLTLEVYNGNQLMSGTSIENIDASVNRANGGTLSFTIDLGESGKFDVAVLLSYFIYTTSTSN